MSPKTLSVAFSMQILLAASAFGVALAISTPAAATAVLATDQVKVDTLTAQIVEAVKTAELSVDCHNKSDPKAQANCQAGITAAIEAAIAQSGASPIVAQAALIQAQSTLAQQGVLTAYDASAIAGIEQIVASQIISTGATGGGIGAGSGPGAQSAIGSPPSGGGGGGSDYRSSGGG